MVPAIWKCDWPNCSFAMSLIGGCSTQPESLTLVPDVDRRAAQRAGRLARVARLPAEPADVGVHCAPLFPAWWWTYMDWMPTRPGPVISARYMLCRMRPGLQRNLLGLHAGPRSPCRGSHPARPGSSRPGRSVRSSTLPLPCSISSPGYWCGDEPVHEHAAAAVQHVGQALDPHERVLDGVRREQEGVLADVEFHARVQRQDHELAGRVAGERDPAGAVGHASRCAACRRVERFIPPCVFSDESGTDSSFHSSTWCSK